MTGGPTLKAQKTTPKAPPRTQDASLDLKTGKLKQAIRHLLKLKGKSYADVAELLDCSLATVKRVMNQEELSLSRLLAICDWLGLSLADLDAAQALETSSGVTFTEEQEIFLAADPRYLVYMYELWDGATPDAIEAKYGIKAKSTQKYLLRLEQIGLVRVTGKGRVVPVHPRQPDWSRMGPLARTNYDKLLTSFSDFFRERARLRFADIGDAAIPGRLKSRVHHGPMSWETYQAMMEELGAVQTRYEELSVLESKIRPKDELGSYAKLVCQAWLNPGENAFELEYVFGRVTDV